MTFRYSTDGERYVYLYRYSHEDITSVKGVVETDLQELFNNTKVIRDDKRFVFMPCRNLFGLKDKTVQVKDGIVGA